jgi:hypothetical protein
MSFQLIFITKIKQSWVIGSFLIQLQLQLQLLLKIFPQLQLQLQLLDFFLM